EAGARHAAELAEARALHAAEAAELRTEKDQLEQALSGNRALTSRLEGELTSARDTVTAREHDLATLGKAIEERDARIATLKGELEELEGQNAAYQDQVLKAYQRIKSDEATVTRAKKAMAIALTLLDEEKGAAKDG
ncbi:MAG: response regulator, partial [Myxococcales bacterium]|nr:response regulator [Myxococcales bacterium]